MANVYVDSNAAGAGTGANWANAYTTLGAATAAKAAGDSFWVAHNHAETAGAAKTITFPGTVSNPNFCYCVNSAGTVPPVSADLRTTATITTTGAFAISAAGCAFVYGIIFSSGSGANSISLNLESGGSGTQRYTNCALRLGGTSGGNINFGSASFGGAIIYLDNTTVQVAATNSLLTANGFVVWRATASAITGGTVPTNCFNFSAARGGKWLVQGVDLSALGSGQTLVNSNSSTEAPTIQLMDCKLGASVTVAATPANHGGPQTDLVRCDSGATNYRTERYRFEGTQTVETTIVRTGGASDGTTTIAHKIITTADSKWVLPFEALPIAIWNDSTASVTVTVYGIWGGGAVPNNDDIWMDVEYLGSALTPQGSFATSTKADNLATASALTTDTSTWGGSTTKFKMTATFTPAQKGAIYIYIKAAAASSTFYIDPKPVLS